MRPPASPTARWSVVPHSSPATPSCSPLPTAGEVRASPLLDLSHSADDPAVQTKADALFAACMLWKARWPILSRRLLGESRHERMNREARKTKTTVDRTNP